MIAKFSLYKNKNFNSIKAFAAVLFLPCTLHFIPEAGKYLLHFFSPVIYFD